MSTPNLSNLSNKLFNRAGFTALAAAALILPACGTPTPEADISETENDVAATTDSNVTTEDLSDNLAAYLGQSVTVREEVEEVVGDYAFLLDDDQLFGGEEILIINASGQPVDLVEGEDTDVQVTGEVRQLILADLEQEYGFDLDNDLFVDYENQPAIVAQSIALAPDADDISDNPDVYYNRRLALNGEVGTIIDTNVVTIEDEELFGGENLLVVSPDQPITVNESEEVTMTGTLRPFVTGELERDYDLTWDLDLQEQLEAEYQDRPVFVVDAVYPSAM
jgi:hemin uptake protein HemP